MAPLNAGPNAGPAGVSLGSSEAAAPEGVIPAEAAPTVPKPSTGRIVRYVGKMGLHAHRAAMVVMAEDTWVGGDVVPLDSPYHVHLWVYTPRTQTAVDGGEAGYGQVSGFPEENIPYDETGAPGTWHWPPRA